MGSRTDRPTPDLTGSTLVRHPDGFYVDTVTGMVLTRIGHGSANGYERAADTYAHRIVWEAIHGSIPTHLSINHLDGVHDNNRPDNLELATQSRQVAHGYEIGARKGNGRSGTEYASRLSDEQVQHIKDARPGTIMAFADAFGISRSYAYQIRGRRRLRNGHGLPGCL